MTAAYNTIIQAAHLCSIRNCVMSSRFVRCHMASSRCIESTSSCKKSISLPSGLAALVRVCIEPRRRSISRLASSRSLRRPASHSWRHRNNETCNQTVSVYVIDIQRWTSTPPAVQHNSYQCTVTLSTGLLNQILSNFKNTVQCKISDTNHKIIAYICMHAKKHMGWSSRASLTLHTDIRWGCLVSFMSQPTWPRCPLCRRFGRPPQPVWLRTTRDKTLAPSRNGTVTPQFSP